MSVTEVRDWTESIIDTILKKTPDNVSRRWYVAAKRRGKELAETAVGPWSGLCALMISEHDKIMRLFHSRKWVEPTQKEERSIIEILGISALSVGGRRIGDKNLFIPSRFTEAPKKRKLVLNKKLKITKKRTLKLRRR